MFQPEEINMKDWQEIIIFGGFVSLIYLAGKIVGLLEEGIALLQRLVDELENWPHA